MTLKRMTLLSTLSLWALTASLEATAHADNSKTIIREWQFQVCGETIPATPPVQPKRPPASQAPSEPLALPRSIVKQVQRTPDYQTRRTEIVSGCRVSLFANFLEDKAGKVHLLMDGVTYPCELTEWQDQSVTVRVPMLGMAGPKDGKIRIIRPDGRIAKVYDILLTPQPDVVIHAETVGQPSPAAPESKVPTYAGDTFSGSQI